jgi:hypothetical protein
MLQGAEPSVVLSGTRVACLISMNQVSRNMTGYFTLVVKPAANHPRWQSYSMVEYFSELLAAFCAAEINLMQL